MAPGLLPAGSFSFSGLLQGLVQNRRPFNTHQRNKAIYWQFISVNIHSVLFRYVELYASRSAAKLLHILIGRKHRLGRCCGGCDDAALPPTAVEALQFLDGLFLEKETDDGRDSLHEDPGKREQLSEKGRGSGQLAADVEEACKEREEGDDRHLDERLKWTMLGQVM